MIAFDILDAVTLYRSFGRTAEMCDYWRLLSGGNHCNATETLAELLTQPAQAALRSRVRDIGELVFARGGLAEMHRIIQQVATIAPDTVSTELVSKWWKGIGVNGAYWTSYAYSTPSNFRHFELNVDAKPSYADKRLHLENPALLSSGLSAGGAMP
jgi:hypothetical protein